MREALKFNAHLASQIAGLLISVEIIPRRMVIVTSERNATVPMLRGVWGAALHGLDRDAYETVFHSEDPRRPPAYVLRPVSDDDSPEPAVECIFIGKAVADDSILLRAWDIASGMGLGKVPDRRPFFVRRLLGIQPDGSLGPSGSPWPLSEAKWPLKGSPDTTPCRLRFVTPLSLQRHKQLINSPTLTDIVAKSCRRIASFLPEESIEPWSQITAELVQLSKEIPSSIWRGERLYLKRYSAAQLREFQVPGVWGVLDLPEGAGDLWPLLNALQWIHVGKSTNVGLGQLVIEEMVRNRPMGQL